MLENTTWSSMQDAPGAENKRQKELERLAAKSFSEGSISDAEAAFVLNAEEAEHTWSPMDESQTSEYDEDELETRILNPGTGIGSYAAFLDKPEKPSMTPEDAVEDLFTKMKPYKNFLIHILEACREEATAETIDAAVEPDYEFCGCVYTPVTLRKMLVEAQALTCITAEAQDQEGTEGEEACVAEVNCTEVPTSPEASIIFTTNNSAVDEDCDIDEIGEIGEGDDVCEEAGAADEAPRGSIYDQPNYLVIESEPEATWLISEAGLAYLNAVSPEREFAAVLDKFADLKEVFFDVLAFCDEAPRNIIDIAQRFQDDKRLTARKIYANFLVDRLEEIGALVWKKDWTTTEFGKKLLAERA